MSARTAGLALFVGIALTSLVALVVGVWPVTTPPPAQRADLRPQLQRRHSTPEPAAAANDGPAAVRETLTARVLCEEPRAGRVALLHGKGSAPRLLVPCADGAQLWSLEPTDPERLAQVSFGASGLELGPSLGTDLDGDGQWDLLFALAASDPGQAYRQGMYWARGRLAGGFEPPVRLLATAVDAMVAVDRAGPDGAAELWLAVHEPPPASRALLWRVEGGAAPQRRSQWELPSPSPSLELPVVGAQQPVLVGLGDHGLWRKLRDDGAAPELWLEVPDALGLSHAGGRLFVRGAEGVREVTHADDDEPSQLGPARGPAHATALARAASGAYVAAAEEGLWTWSGEGSAEVFEGAGGARVETVLSAGAETWLWLSGLGGAQATGLAALPIAWPPASSVELLARPAPEGLFEAALAVP